jgi:alpha/beta superfamily hydrolase
MRMKTSLLLTLAALCLSGVLCAETRPVEISPELKGEWIAPDKGWDGRTVLVFHGLADDMDGPRDLTKRAALALVENGIATLRINFRGEGDKKRTKIESTLFTRLEDAAAAREFALKQPGVDAAKLCLFGWSLGATTALETAASFPATYRSMAVWCAPAGDLYEVLTAEPALKQAALDAEKTGWGTADMGWKKIELSHAFFESFKGHHTDRALAAYPGAFFSLRGSEDFLPQGEAAFMKVTKGRPSEAVIIAGADHIFHTFQPELGFDVRAIEVTVAWFVRTLR